MLFGDHDLPRRIEAGEARVAWQWTQAHARLLPNGGSAAEMIAGGCAAFGGVDSPVTQAQGLEMNGPVEFALDAACDLARVLTQPGSGSQRNAEHKGLQVVYTRAAMAREFGEPPSPPN